MTDDELRPNLVELEQYENRCRHFYNDTATPPNVTIGVGCVIFSVDDACDLPMVHAVSGTPAARDEIAAEYMRVRSMRGSMPARVYKGPLLLSDADIDQLAFKRMRVFLAALPTVFPGFDSYPLHARQCLLDLAWNNGLGGPGSSKGLWSWTHLRAACARFDWPAAALECTVANPLKLVTREARNVWRAGCFIAAQQSAGL